MDPLLRRQLEALEALKEQETDTGGTKAPGRSTVTSRMSAAPQVVFRVADPETARALGEALSGGHHRVQREASEILPPGRDANGVAPGADVAVERAAGSIGSPLRDDLRTRFETSLGTDLSQVRVHTSPTSAEANHAVGARAYTVGNDIHFNAGQYQPDDPFGMHLLAHEVAHTVQQAGAAPVRQNRLEVSTPHDALEYEADRAADAMVVGRSVSGLTFGSGINRKVIARGAETEHVDDEMKYAEKDAKTEINASSSSVGATFSIDKNAKAELSQKIGMVDGWTKAMEEQSHTDVGSAMNSSGPGSGVTPEKIGENVKTSIVLKEYAAALDNEGGDLGAIKNQHAVVKIDYTRALAAINAAGTLYGIDLTASKGDGAKAANLMQKGMGVDSNEAEKLSTKNETAVSQLTGKANQYNTAIGTMKEKGFEVKAQVAVLKGATARFQVYNLTKEIKEKTAELATAKAKEAEIKGVVSMVSSSALAALGAESLVKFELPTASVADAAKGQAKGLASKGAQFLLDEAKENLIDGPITKAIADLTGLTQKIKDLSTALGSLSAEVDAKADIAAASDLEAARSKLAEALAAFDKARKEADNLKHQLRDEWQRLGKKMDQDAGGGEKYALIAKTVGECDAFFGQAQKVYDTIAAWQTSTRKESKDKKEGINSSNKDHGLTAYEFILADPVKRIYGVVTHPIVLNAFALNVNEGQHPVVQAKAIKGDLRALGRTLMDYRNNIVKGAMGINVPFPEVSFLNADAEEAPEK